VIEIIGLVTLNYWQLIRRFPEGGGSPEAAGRAFGEAWAFLPIAALVVDFASPSQFGRRRRQRRHCLPLGLRRRDQRLRPTGAGGPQCVRR